MAAIRWYVQPNDSAQSKTIHTNYTYKQRDIDLYYLYCTISNVKIQRQNPTSKSDISINFNSNAYSLENNNSTIAILSVGTLVCGDVARCESL